jgi:hypothetical protein
MLGVKKSKDADRGKKLYSEGENPQEMKTSTWEMKTLSSERG